MVQVLHILAFCSGRRRRAGRNCVHGALGARPNAARKHDRGPGERAQATVPDIVSCWNRQSERHRLFSRIYLRRIIIIEFIFDESKLIFRAFFRCFQTKTLLLHAAHPCCNLFFNMDMALDEVVKSVKRTGGGLVTVMQYCNLTPCETGSNVAI